MGEALSYDLAHGTTNEDTLETIFEVFLNEVRMAASLAEVNVAAGVAHDSVNALSLGRQSVAAN